MSGVKQPNRKFTIEAKKSREMCQWRRQGIPFTVTFPSPRVEGFFVKYLIHGALMVTLFSAAAVPGLGQRPEILQEGIEAFYAGRVTEARLLIEGYLRLNPEDPAARILLARALATAGENEQAFLELKQVLEKDPENVDALFYLGALTAALSQAEYSRLHEMAPDSARVHQLLGDSFRARRSFKEAEQEYVAALAAQPDLVEVIVELGDLKREQGDFESSATYYDRALTIDADNYRALYGLGVCSRFRQNNQEAITYYRRSIEIAPGYAPAYLALGTSLIQEGDYENAVATLLTAIELEPGMDQAYFQLGRAYQALGETAKADQAFEKARQLKAQSQTSPP